MSLLTASQEPPERPADAAGRGGLAHFGVNVASVDAAVEELERAGVAITARPKTMGILNVSWWGAEGATPG